MNDYGGSSSRNRQIIKSPNPHALQDPKVIKKKYQQLKQTYKTQKKHSESLQSMVKTLKEQNMKQQKQLCKKDEQIDILLDQIKYLKGVIADNHSKKSSKEISSFEEQLTIKSTHSEEVPSKAPVVGGYFGSIFN